MPDDELKNPFPSPSPPQPEVDAFVEAAGKGDTAAVISFLDKYAGAADLKNSAGNTALAHAAYMGEKGIVALLLEKGARVDGKDQSGWTPSMYPAACGEKEVLALLLEKGASIEGAADKDEWTLLMLAASSGHTDTVALLLEKGADIESRDCTGKTALALAKDNDHHETAELICRRIVLKEREIEARAKASAATRLEKLKNRRPPQSPLKKKM